MTAEALKIDLSMLEEGVHEAEYVLDDAFFQSLEQTEISGGAVRAKTVIRRHNESFLLTLAVEGNVIVTCDRCLEPVTMEVKSEDELSVRLGDRNDEDESGMTVDRRQPVLDLGWLLYEESETSLPVVCRHREGECNPQMEELLRAHLCTTEEDK